jgi:hypothetical protein
LHYRVPLTGIDLGDTTACLRGRTVDGVPIFGCDGVLPH